MSILQTCTILKPKAKDSIMMFTQNHSASLRGWCNVWPMPEDGPDRPSGFLSHSSFGDLHLMFGSQTQSSFQDSWPEKPMVLRAKAMISIDDGPLIIRTHSPIEFLMFFLSYWVGNSWWKRKNDGSIHGFVLRYTMVWLVDGMVYSCVVPHYLPSAHLA